MSTITPTHETDVTPRTIRGTPVAGLANKLRAAGATEEWRGSNQGIYHIPNERFIPLLREIVSSDNGRLATVTGIDVRDGTELLYHMCFDPPGFTATLKILVPRETDAMESVTPWLPGAEFIEREIRDLLGVDFPGHPRMERLILADDWPEGVYPLRRGFKKEHAERARQAAPTRTTPTPRTARKDGKRTLVSISPPFAPKG